MGDTLLILYCLVDEFCKEFYPAWESPADEKRILKILQSNQGRENYHFLVGVDVASSMQTCSVANSINLLNSAV